MGCWLQSTGGPGASVGALVYEAMSWAPWWTGLGPKVAVGSGGLKAADLLMGGAVSPPG